MDELAQLLEAVAQGTLDPTAAAGQIRAGGAPLRMQESDLTYAVIDDARAHRTGLPEIVYGEGKTPRQIVGIFEHLRSRKMPALATRVSAECAALVQQQLPGVTYEPVPRLLWRDPPQPGVEGPVWVISAGTSDMRVAEEAARCAEWFGLGVERAFDVGIAGLHRLLARLEGLRGARVVIAVAGMEGALPSVVAGLIRAPVVAVPTSVGYGANLGGMTALLAMVNSCAAGVSVVNIDNGFGAAQVAWRIAHT